MGPPEISEGASIWQQIGSGLAIGAAGLGWLLIQIFKGRSDAKSEPKQVVLERAELADMQPVRDMARQWGESMKRLDELHQMSADVERTKHDTEMIRETVEKIERRLEIDAAVREDRARRGGHSGD